MAKVKRLDWPGMGYARVSAKGVLTYYIERTIDGHDFHISTRCHTAQAALVEYTRWEKDKHSYKPLVPEAEADSVFLGPVLQEAYLKHCAKHDRITADWYRQKRLYLSWWGDALEDVDLRKLDLERDILPKLKQRSGRKHAISILKHLISWLRNPEWGPSKDDGRLYAEQGRCILDWEPQHKTRAKQEDVERSFPYDSWLKVRPHLSEWMQDAGDVLAATGWHSTELKVFVEKIRVAGRVTDPPGTRPQKPGIGDFILLNDWRLGLEGATNDKVLHTIHKGGHLHKTRVSAEIAAVALRAQVRDSLDLNRFTNRLAWLCRPKKGGESCPTTCPACKLGDPAPFAMGIKPAVTPGAFRHSVATWMVNGGVPLEEVSTFLGHLSAATTKIFYVTHGVPKNPALVRATVEPQPPMQTADSTTLKLVVS